MKDRITEIELKMEYSKVVDIAKEWVRETKFAVFETTDKRVLYKQNQGLSGTQWIFNRRNWRTNKAQRLVRAKKFKPRSKWKFLERK